MALKRPYTYYDMTTSICPRCLKRIYAKIIFENDKVFMLKKCSEHGDFKVLIATDIEYYKRTRNYIKQSERPYKFLTKTKYGCPYDCGLCEDHEQHSCSSIIELTDRCNLSCPTCYSSSGPNYGRHRSLEEIEKMIDIIIETEKKPDLVQISGGEPTIHPKFFEILDVFKTKPIEHILLNTNGIRIANEEGFAEKLATYAPNFELYLQWDSLNPKVIKKLRGADLFDIKKKALEKLNKLNLSTTLVVVVEKGLNDHELGVLVEFALKQKCVRGITFQPTQYAGRNENFNPETDKITPTEVRTKIIQQQNIFSEEDLIPVPCNPDTLTMAYAFKKKSTIEPLTRYINPAELLEHSRNSIVYEKDELIKDKLMKAFSTGNSPQKSVNVFKSLLCCLPKFSIPKEVKYENIFRIIIMHFQDAYDFDVRVIKKSCVHIVHKDGRIIPFETMNLFYRDNEKILQKLQQKNTL